MIVVCVTWLVVWCMLVVTDLALWHVWLAWFMLVMVWACGFVDCALSSFF